MKKPVPLLLCALAVWITGFAYYQSQTSCACSALAAQNATSAARTLSFVDAAKNIDIDMSGQLLFEVGKYEFMTLSDAAKANIGQIVTHLKNNPDRTLVITGLFNPQEKNESKYHTLGEARAQVVKGLLVSEGCPETQIEINKTLGEVKNLQAIQFEGVEFAVKTPPQ